MLILKPLSIDWSVVGAQIPTVTFITHVGLTTHELAHTLDSLVRVSRRVERNHFVRVTAPRTRTRHARTLRIQVHPSGQEGTYIETKRRHTLQRRVLPHAFIHPEAKFHSRRVLLVSKVALTHKTRSTTCIQIKTH